MEYLCLVCAFACFAAAAAGFVLEARAKRKKTKTFLKLIEGYEIVKKQALEPFIGSEMIVKDLFGAVSRGTLTSVTDEGAVLVSAKGKNSVQTVVATEYIASFEVSEKK
ncbi:MAG: hypothetical protein NC132_06380 [Corallococcus sp.]|nr:hypothetical protein [Corallococcus sp.]MCM1359764.1 hypothetical protein [Corallococcus sp.]MCM1395710.1 hypothetical protein [Corallococcus sp.]